MKPIRKRKTLSNLGEGLQKFYLVRRKCYKIEFLSSADVIFVWQSLQSAVGVFQE